jgi:hypothetical protein
LLFHTVDHLTTASMRTIPRYTYELGKIQLFGAFCQTT